MFDICKLFKKEKKASVLKNLIKNPDDHFYTMEVDKDEIVIRIKRKAKEQV